MTTRAEAIDAAAQIFATGYAIADLMTPAELARACWTPTSTQTVEELEAAIRAERGLPPKGRDA